MPAPNQAVVASGAIQLQAVASAGLWKDTIGADFSAGIPTNLTVAGATTVYAGGIATSQSFFISPTDSNLPNYSFESAGNWNAVGYGDNYHAFTLADRQNNFLGQAPADGSWCAVIKFTLQNGGDFNTFRGRIYVEDENGNSLGYPLEFSGTNPWASYAVNPGASGIAVGQKMRLKLWAGDNGGGQNYAAAFESDTFVWSGFNITVRYALQFTQAGAVGAVGWDFVTGGRADYSGGGGNLISRESPAVSTNPDRTWAKVTINADMTGGGTVTLGTSSYAASGTAYAGGDVKAVTLTQSGTGQNTTFTGWIESARDNYLKYKVTLTGVVGGTPIVKDVTIEYFCDDNYYVSTPYNLGSTPTAWGNLTITAFSLNRVNGSATAITYPAGPPGYLGITAYARSGTGPNGPWGAWTAQTIGSPISGITLNPFVQLYFRLTTTDVYSGGTGRQAMPIIEDFTIAFSSGAIANRPSAVWWKRRYLCSVQSPGFTYQSHVHVLSKDMKGWVLHDSLDVGHYCIFRGRLLAIKSSLSYFAVEEHDVGGTDSGAPITTTMRTRDEDWGSPQVSKDLIGTHVTVRNNLLTAPNQYPTNASGLVQVTPYRDGVAGVTAPCETQGNNPNRIALSVAPTRGHTLGLEVKHTRANENLEVLALAVEFRQQPRAR